MKGICFNTGRTHFKKGMIPWNKGKKIPFNSHPGRKGKVINEEHPLWKGDNAGYRAIHYWVERRLGKPMCCDYCGTIKGRRFHWANIDGMYKRIITDWIRLCPKCHKKFDTKRKRGVVL
jgi:hypothetical protein